MKYLPIKPENAQEIAEIEMCLFDNCFNEHTLKTQIEVGEGFVAQENETIVGYILSHTSENLTDILRVGVVETHQRKGIGKTLLRMLLDSTKDKTSSTILCVKKDNKKAIEMYKTHEFFVIGETKNSWVLRRH